MFPSLAPRSSPMRPVRASLASAVAVAALLGGVTASGVTFLPAAAQAATTMTIFGSQVPTVASDPDTSGVELGVRFSSDVPGQIEGIRFYKGAANTGTHTGSLWSGSTRVATASFTSETTAGWQTVRFATPVKVTAGTSYTASYWAPRGRYAVAEGFFAQPKVAAPLRATAGVYRYGGGHPTSTYRSSNYFVDVTFTPAVTAPLPSATTAPTTPPPSPTATAPAPAPSPSTTTTTPAPTVTAPAVGSYPGSGTAGVPTGTVLRPSSSLVLSTPGAVVDGLDITGTVQINASNVTLRRSRVTTGSAFSVIRVKEGVTGVRIEDVTVNGRGSSGTSGSMGIMGPATVVRADISGVENGFTPSSGSVLQDSWIHNLNAPGSPHLDGVQIDGGQSNILLQRNTIDLREWSQTAAIMIDNYFGPIDGIRVDNNRLLGAGYTVYSDGQFSGGSIRNVSFTNNRFIKGSWGYALIRNNATTPVWTGNVIDGTTTPVNP